MSRNDRSVIVGCCLILLAVLFIGSLNSLKKCSVDQPQTHDITDSLKNVIRGQIKAQDSLKVIASGKDSVRVEYVLKWRKLKETVYDTIQAPCDSILPIVINTCDSVIYADSSLIASLKDIILTDSLIIGNQALVIKTDSSTIVGLNKEIKKHKRHKKLLIGALVVTTILAIVK